jgi:uracil phosphoribosyltransferase
MAAPIAPPASPPAPMTGPLRGTHASAPPARKVNVTEHPIAQHALTVLRNKRTASAHFRVVSNQLLALLVLEATRSLPTRDESVETSAGSQSGRALVKPVVFLSLARHGLGLAHSMVEFFPDLQVGTITLEPGKEGQPPKPRLHLVNAPALSDARVILFDPIVSNGLSLGVALNLLRRSGATDISLLSFVVAFPEPGGIQAAFPDLTVWTVAVEDDAGANPGLKAGLGNFAERLYG